LARRVREGQNNTILPVPALTAVDLFSGAGGTTQGLRNAGYAVLAAVENDAAAARSFAANHSATALLERDIRRVQAPTLARQLLSDGRRLTLLTACPPCQPFSTLGSGRADDPRNALVSSVLRFIRHLRPQAVLLENVPGLRHEPRFERLVAALSEDYVVADYIVQATDFGIPQNRRRMIVLAIERGSNIVPPEDLVGALPEGFDVSPTSAGEAIAMAAHLSTADDPIHRARTPRPKTLERILAMKQGGGRTQLPEHLQLACHTRLKTRAATSIYGRIDPAKPAPTMTTRCTTPSCGRFVHPTENRGLTLREAAVLQSFPLDYEFRGFYDQIERQIGNAVPPRLAEALGAVIAGLIGSSSSGADPMECRTTACVP
jgi:DNA (cytosine-5)-methyltransferase 1